MINIFHRDCMEAMAEMPDKAYELAIVDPPYSDTFTDKACGDNAAPKGRYNLSTLNGCKPSEEYWYELMRVSRNQIVWGVNWYGRYFGIGGICWFKDNTGNYSPCEYAYQSFDNHVYHFEWRWNGMLQGDMKNKEQRFHPTQKPVKLYEWLLKNYAKPGDRILDTHGGSCSIAIACYNLDFDLDCFEIDAEYHGKAVERLEKHMAQGRLFGCSPAKI